MIAVQNSLLILLLAFLYYTTGWLSLEALSGDKIVSLGIFIPEGIALGFALYFGKRVLPGIFFGQLLLAYNNMGDMAVSFEIALINVIEAFIGIYLFNKLHLSKSLESFRDILGLFLIIVFILQPFSAVFSNIFLMLHGEAQSSEFLYLTYSWWFGNVMGQFLFTPFILVLLKNYKDIHFEDYMFYGVVYFMYMYMLTVVFKIENLSVLISFSFIAVILVVVRKGFVYGTFLIIIASMIGGYSIYIHEGAFFISDTLNNTINYNLFVLSHILVVWVLGILFEERKRYEQTLKQRIAEEVQKNKEQELFLLQQNRLAQMGELLSMIAHQWRQPLNNLSLINQLLVNKFYKGKLDTEAVEYFKENSRKQIVLMSSTIDDFRNFFKNGDRQKEFSVNHVVQNVLKMTEPSFERYTIEVVFDVTKEYTLFGHENSLAQALLNILNNAKDVLLEKQIEEKKIFIDIKEKDGEIFLSIEDNAGGIDNAIIEKIFDPYFSTKHEKNGTGLGLYMSKMIIEEQMKGKLEVQNTDKGAKFIINIRGGIDS